MAFYEKQNVRLKLLADQARLGHITCERHGASLVESWQEGMLFHELNIRWNAVQDLKLQFENSKKDIAKQLKKTKR